MPRKVTATRNANVQCDLQNEETLCFGPGVVFASSLSSFILKASGRNSFLKA